VLSKRWRGRLGKFELRPGRHEVERVASSFIGNFVGMAILYPGFARKIPFATIGELKERPVNH